MKTSINKHPATFTKGSTEKVEYVAHNDFNQQHTLVYGADWKKKRLPQHSNIATIAVHLLNIKAN
ncbi:hypothetical protein RS130_20900 [Paraglaciecola aquimarina]|uniref:Uncharacterized protein n=1 Tax=Paraglaciecola aquimarina TaxID=1235557 RepID=A0ABU3T169_9ALTE|nr:hypothetical protein [Paraglaciecola aquimarina]MDU0356019.1 hypothetical protein [Paraglaciecola aquimarina]